MRPTIFAAIVAAVVLLSISCAAVQPRTKDDIPRSNLLPLANGWYQYDFTRTFRDIETEQAFAAAGVELRQEITFRYTGVVVSVEDGFLFDPVTGIELFIDCDGNISSPESMSIRGNMSNDGTFHWGGFTIEHGRLTGILVYGTLTPLPRSARGGPEFDGVFHMTDSGSGRPQLVRISDGFYTWNFADDGEEWFTPWPTLVQPDGRLSFSIDIITTMEMVGISSMSFSNTVSVEGRVIPGQGIIMEELVRTAGIGEDQSPIPQIFSGTTIRYGEFPNEAIPENIDALVRAGRAAVRSTPRPNPANYPDWYLNPPRREGYIFATGEKTFSSSDVALRLAEAGAAARLADQIMIRIISEIIAVTGDTRTMIDSRIRTEAFERVNYRIAEQYFNEQTQTAFVLLEMRLD